MDLTTKIKLGCAIFLIGMLAVFIALNTQVIEVNFLIGKIEIRRSIMIIATLIIGVFAGWALRSALISKKK